MNLGIAPDGAEPRRLDQDAFVSRIVRMRGQLRRLSQLIGLLIALAVPAVYFTAGYFALQDDLTFKAELGAERLARHAYVHGPTWVYGAEHVAAEMTLTAAADGVICQRVFDSQGRLIVHTDHDIMSPLVRVGRPIRVGNQIVGQVDVAASLNPLLAGTGLAGLLGLLLGALAWLTMNRLPERSLQHSLEALRQVHDDSTRQSAETIAAYDELHRQYRLVTDMTAQLTQARDDAMIADRSKSAFLATMSHELRTPLNAIIGFSDMIRNEVLGTLGHAQYRRYVQDIHDSGQHLLTIVNDILDLSKIEAGQMALHLEEVAVAEVIAECDRLMGAKAAAAGIRLLTPAPHDLPVLRADPMKLKQVVLNLLSNAVKFTPQGGTVTVSVAQIEDWQVKIAVADTGIGMSDHDVTVALKPFQQVDNTISRKYEGTGLGLPLTRALVELHAGALTIASVAGKGTTVTITLPLQGPPFGHGTNRAGAAPYVSSGFSAPPAGTFPFALTALATGQPAEGKQKEGQQIGVSGRGAAAAPDAAPEAHAPTRLTLPAA